MFEIPQHIRALIFDCDGTLVDSVPNHLAAWFDALRLFGFHATREEIMRGAGTPTREMIRDIAERNGWTVDADEFARAKDAFYQKRRAELSIIPETVAIVREYSGKLPMAVVSGGTRNNVLHALECVDLAQHFDLIITASDGLPSKASPEVFLHVAAHFKVAPHACLVFEDSDLAIATARSAGMLAVRIGSS